MPNFRVTAEIVEKRYVTVKAPSQKAAQDWIDHTATMADFTTSNGGRATRRCKIRQMGSNHEIELDTDGVEMVRV